MRSLHARCCNSPVSGSDLLGRICPCTRRHHSTAKLLAGWIGCSQLARMARAALQLRWCPATQHGLVGRLFARLGCSNIQIRQRAGARQHQLIAAAGVATDAAAATASSSSSSSPPPAAAVRQWQCAGGTVCMGAPEAACAFTCMCGNIRRRVPSQQAWLCVPRAACHPPPAPNLAIARQTSMKQ